MKLNVIIKIKNKIRVNKVIKKLIVIENEIHKGFDSKEDLIKELLSEDYYNLTKEEQYKTRNTKILLNCIIAKLYHPKFSKMELDEIKDMMILDNDITYILSLLSLENMVILEEKNANIFLKDEEFDKTIYKDNYIILNSCLDKLFEIYKEK